MALAVLLVAFIMLLAVLFVAFTVLLSTLAVLSTFAASLVLEAAHIRNSLINTANMGWSTKGFRKTGA
jgi:hypothetical protein